MGCFCRCAAINKAYTISGFLVLAVHANPVFCEPLLPVKYQGPLVRVSPRVPGSMTSSTTAFKHKLEGPATEAHVIEIHAALLQRRETSAFSL